MLKNYLSLCPAEGTGQRGRTETTGQRDRGGGHRGQLADTRVHVLSIFVFKKDAQLLS